MEPRDGFTPDYENPSWLHFYPAIKRMYATEHRSVRGITTLLATQYAFHVRERDLEKRLRRWGLLDESGPSERKIVEIVETTPSASRHAPPLATKHLETKPRTDEEMLRNIPSPIGHDPVESFIGMTPGSRNIQIEAIRSSGTALPEPSNSNSLFPLGNKSGRQLWPYGKNVRPLGPTCLWCYLLGEDCDEDRRCITCVIERRNCCGTERLALSGGPCRFCPGSMIDNQTLCVHMRQSHSSPTTTWQVNLHKLVTTVPSFLHHPECPCWHRESYPNPLLAAIHIFHHHLEFDPRSSKNINFDIDGLQTFIDPSNGSAEALYLDMAFGKYVPAHGFRHPNSSSMVASPELGKNAPQSVVAGLNFASHEKEQARSIYGGGGHVPEPLRHSMTEITTGPLIPCPERICRWYRYTAGGLKSHLADHAKDATFHCLHCFWETSHAEKWKIHHSVQHDSCLTERECVRETRRERKYWGCGLCRNLFTNIESYIAHYAEHFQANKSRQPNEISLSTTIQSLLLQDATRERWQKRTPSVIGDRLIALLVWDEADIIGIKDALEYGIFDGSSISEAGVAERLLDELARRAKTRPWPRKPPSSSLFSKAVFTSVGKGGRNLAQSVEELDPQHQQTAAVQRRSNHGPGEVSPLPDAVGKVTTTNRSSGTTADRVNWRNRKSDHDGINGGVIMALTQPKEQLDVDHQEGTETIHQVSPVGLEVMRRLRQDNAELQQKNRMMMARIEVLEKRENIQHQPIHAWTPCSSKKSCLGVEEDCATVLATKAEHMDDINLELVKAEVESMAPTPAQTPTGQSNELRVESMQLDEKIPCSVGSQFELEIIAFLKEQALQGSKDGPPLSAEVIFQWFRVWLRSFRFPRSSSSWPVGKVEEVLDLKEVKAETDPDASSFSQRRRSASSVGTDKKPHFKDEADVDNCINDIQQHIYVKVESESTSLSPVESDDAFMESSGEESFILDEECVPALDTDSRVYVERVASELGQELARDFLSTLAERRTTTCTQRTSQESSGGFSTGMCSQAAAESSTAPTSVTKRSSRKRRLSDEEDEEDARKRKKPRLEKVGEDEATSDGLLACPYSKHDPIRYSEANQILSEKPYRRCRTVYLTNIPRLKQHLYRVHRRPEYYCSSCYMDFATENECETHSRSRLCVLRVCPFEEKMTSDQCKAVKRRRMGETPVNAWFGIFEILFPGAERPNDPYVECAILQAALPGARDYAAFLENRLPSRLSERLGGPLYGSDDPMTQWLINVALEETLPTVLHDLLGEYQTLNPEDSGDAGTD